MISQRELRALVDLQLEIHRGLDAWKSKRAQIHQRIQQGEQIEPGTIRPEDIDVAGKPAA